MKKSLLIIAAFLITLTSFSQEYRKYWSEGKLEWSDFQGKHTKKHATYLSYLLTYQTDKKIIDNVLYEGVFSDAYIDKSLSFVHPNLKDDFYLNYNQVIFNLIELSKRKLQKRFFELDNVFESNSLLLDSKNQLERRIFDFQQASNYGIQKDVTNRWLVSTTKELATTNNFMIPDYKRSNWTYGLYGGVDFGIYGGNYKEYFNNTLALTFGFEFSYKKIYLLLNMAITNSKLNKDLVDTDLFLAKGEKTLMGNFNAAIGYPVYETKKMKFTPFVGYGISSFGEVGDNKNKNETTAGTSVFGLNVDFKNRKRVNFTPSLFNIREEGNSFIRARVFVSNSSFNPNLKGYSINIGVAYGFEARLLSKK